MVFLKTTGQKSGKENPDFCLFELKFCENKNNILNYMNRKIYNIIAKQNYTKGMKWGNAIGKCRKELKVLFRQVLHEGDYWTMRLFVTDETSPLLTSIKTDRNLLNFAKLKNQLDKINKLFCRLTIQHISCIAELNKREREVYNGITPLLFWYW